MKHSEFPDTCIRVCLDVQQEGRFEGTLSGVTIKDPIAFGNLGEFVVKVDEAYDAIGKPQASQILRSFKDDAPAYRPYRGMPPRYHTSDEIRRLQGQAATLDLIMLSRHHTEWQGLLKDTEGRLIGSFESVLACVGLIGAQNQDS